MNGKEEPLADFVFRSEDTTPESRESATVPLSVRFRALTADALAVGLAVALALLAATLLRGKSLGPAGYAWAAGFAVYLSFFALVSPLILFGKTVGMALSGLSVSGRARARLRPKEAVLRWAGTLSTVATAGILLLWSHRDPKAPTPADRFSGCSLVRRES